MSSSDNMVLHTLDCWTLCQNKLRQDTHVRQKRFGINKLPYQKHNIYTFLPPMQLSSRHDLFFMAMPEVPTTIHGLAFDMCPHCWSFDKRYQTSGDVMCVNCFQNITYNQGVETSYSESHGFGSYLSLGESNKEPRSFTHCYYKRVAHFHTWLHKIQGQEIYTIPSHAIRVIHTFLLERNMAYTLENILCAMKRLQLQKHYDNVYFLFKHFNGFPIIEFTQQQIELLLRLFYMIQEPFAKYRHITKRTNMLHYGYLLVKFFEILGWTDLICCIKPVKSFHKLYLLDKVWKLIAEDLGFPFHRSSM